MDPPRHREWLNRAETAWCGHANSYFDVVLMEEKFEGAVVLCGRCKQLGLIRTTERHFKSRADRYDPVGYWDSTTYYHVDKLEDEILIVEATEALDMEWRWWGESCC